MGKQLRSEIISAIQSSPDFDLVIIGGGIHGAVAARLAAEQGLKILLLEKHDYAFGTSSRSSKMAHGGLRYLEMFDFKQVFEGVKCREKLYRDYPDNVKPYPFYIPVMKNDYWFRLKLSIGLRLYDFFVKNKEQKHFWVSRDEVYRNIPELKSKNLMGCYCYYDGILDDARLVRDNISMAESKSALALNQAEVKRIKDSIVYFYDSIGGIEYQLRAKTILNVTGNNVSDFTDERAPILKHSQGTHLLFSKKWDKPALFLPMQKKARYYFVWPHPAGTMVGTTEREITELAEDPQPTESEIEEILARLKTDLPDSGLNKDSMCGAFAGIRALPLRKRSYDTTQISRKHIWHQSGNILSLFGGKLTTSEWSAKEGLRMAMKMMSEK